MHRSSARRYAVYYAPEEGSPLGEFGRRWLGRDSVTGQHAAGYSIPDFSGERLQELTSSPRHYGFHGTLKPPFRLADGVPPDRLYGTVCSLASGLNPFVLGPLELKWLGKFLALVPSTPNQQLSDVAAECVRCLDDFRAPPSGEELARRRSSGLTGNQEKLLERWGYPYVMEEFRFHLTLTDPIGDTRERDSIFSIADNLTRSFRHSPVAISSLCIFEQGHEKAPFMLTHRFRFQADIPAA